MNMATMGSIDRVGALDQLAGMIRWCLLWCLFQGVLMGAPAVKVLAWDDAVSARKLSLVRGESEVEITGMHPNKRSGALRLKGAGPVFLRALDKAAGEDGKPVQRECKVPEGMTHPLLLVMADEKHPTGVRVVVFDDNPAEFPWGAYRFLNATPKEMVAQMEQKAVKLPTGWKAVNLTLDGDVRGVGARLALAEKIETPLYTAIWEYDPTIRTLCFIVPATDPRMGVVEVKAVPEDRRTVELEAQDERAAGGGAAAESE